jgi:CRISPR-associated exonuclease Cas4
MRMEDNSSDVAIGQLVGKYTYPHRSQKWRELTLEGIKIDHFDPKQNIVREVKKSPKLEKAHIAQVRYYLYRLVTAGIKDPIGVIEYPRLKRTVNVTFSDKVAEEVRSWITDIELIVRQKECPPVISKSYCKRCAYHDFCYV